MSADFKELSIWELYFSFKGRLGRRDFGWYYFFPSVVGGILFGFLLVASKEDYPGDEIYGSPVFLSFLAVYLPITVMAYGKRVRDMNGPIWVGLIPLFIIGGLLFASSFFPSMSGLVDKITDSSVGTAITAGFWVPKGTEGPNLYGPPCKVVLFKKRIVV